MSEFGHHPHERMVDLISKHQMALHQYIYTLMGNIEGSADVLQETNLVLWNKADEYDASRPFLPWARTIARYQVKAAKRDKAREKMVFCEDVEELIHAEWEELNGRYAPTRNELTLALCISKLKPKQKKLLSARYLDGLSLKKISKLFLRPQNSVSQDLHLIRKALKKCVEIRSAAPKPIES